MYSLLFELIRKKCRGLGPILLVGFGIYCCLDWVMSMLVMHQASEEGEFHIYPVRILLLLLLFS